MIALLTAIALADPPPRPDPAPVVAGECARTVRWPVAPPPACSGYLIPDSELADLLADREWALQLSDDYRADEAAWAAERLAYDARIEAAKTPWYNTGAAGRVEGAVGVVAVMAVTTLLVVEVRQ